MCYGISVKGYFLIGGIKMEKRYDIIHAVILVLFLVVAVFIGNAIVKGILLLLFSGVLIFSTIIKLMKKKDDKIKGKIFYGILLFLDSMLALSSVFVIASAIVDTF